MHPSSTQSLPNLHQGCLQIALDQRSPKAQHGVPSPTKLGLPASIRRCALGMIEVSIHLKNETSRTTEEVHDVAPDDLLTTKLDAKPSAADCFPEQLL